MLAAAIILTLTLGIFFAFSMGLITFWASVFVYKKCKLPTKKVFGKAMGDAGLAFVTGLVLIIIAAILGICFFNR